MNNNLINISNTDIVYQSLIRNIAKYLPEDLRVVYNNVPQIPIITGDSYFLHYSVYPMLREKNDDQILEKVRELTSEYMGTKNYQRVKTITTLDDEMSRIYAFELAMKLLEEIEKEIKKKVTEQGGKFLDELVQQVQQQQLSSQMGKQGQSQQNNQAVQELQQAVQQALQKILNNPMKMQSIQKEVQERTETADKVRRLLSGGKQAGKEPGSFERLIDLTDEILQTNFGRELLTFSDKMLSHLPRFTHKIKKKDTHGEELAGYRTTKRIERAIPRELALPEELFLKKFANGFLSREKLSTYEGAFYVLIDKSGSMMHGNKTLWSRSVAFALFKLARSKGRKYFLRFFDKNTYKLETEPDEIIRDIFTIKCDGGTDIDEALSTALKDLNERKLNQYTNTIILITDGEDRVSIRREDLRKVNAKLISIMIEGYNETLKEISDTFMKAQLTKEGVLKVVEVVK